jgi:hypothetical protein
MRLFQLDPVVALHEYWKHSSPEAHIAVGGGGFIGWLTHLDLAAALSFFGLIVMIAGGTVIQLYKQWRLMEIEVATAQRVADADIEERFGTSPKTAA